MADLRSTAEAIAREAGALLRDFYHRGVRMEYKGHADIVTEADRASERLIGERLRAAFPGHGIYGEEGTRSGLDSEFRWYVDPLDGTTNFAHGFPAFCVVLGCERRAEGLKADEDGQMVAGVIYDPLRDEMFSAARGAGATLNGEVIHVSRAKWLQESLIATGFPSQKRHLNPNAHFYQEFTLRSHGVRRAGSAALDLAYVACGRLDGYWEFQLNPWDTSAGYLLVEEAGGKVTHFDGSRFTLDSREVLATNGLIHAEMQQLFADMFAGRGLEPIPTPAEFAARRAAGGLTDVVEYDVPPPSEPGRRKSVWPQVVFVFLMAALAQVLGLVYAYVARCKPGQGNDFCGAGSLAGVLIGFVAAIVVLVAGLIVVFLRRKKVGGGSGPGAGRIVAAVFGAILLVPCVWMIVVGWPRNNSNSGLWFMGLVGLGMILAAILVKRRTTK